MNAPVLNIDASFPRKLAPLLETKARYKVFYGGRGAGRSWGIVRALLIRGVKEPGLRVLCSREVQSSIKESVHQLMRDQIKLMGLGNLYRVLDNEIRGPGGTLFMFKGLSDPEAIKSMEGVDVVFLEEARSVTKGSWEKLDPTIRKDGSEVWIAFNPELDSDFIYQLFVKNTPPPGSIVTKVSWFDNPWFPAVLHRQMVHMRATDYDNYLHIWEGNCKAALEGAVYAKELRLATKQERICRFPAHASKLVHTFWDLGRSDYTAIWFVQMFGMENRVIRYYSNNGEHISHYIGHLRDLEASEGYHYGTMWLPHDADEERLQSKRTTRQQVEEDGFKVRIVPKISVAEGIQAARTIFPTCWFHEGDCGSGLDALRNYHYDVKDDQGGETRSKNPVHSWASHGADAFRYMGVALREETPKKVHKPMVRATIRPSPRSWMAH